MSYEQPVEVDDNWFTGEDKLLDAAIYVDGTTQAAAEADTGVRENVTGWTVMWALRKSQDGGGAILTKTANIVGDPTQGNLEVIIDHADTTDLEPGEYFHSWARIDTGQAILLFGDAHLRHGAIR